MGNWERLNAMAEDTARDVELKVLQAEVTRLTEINRELVETHNRNLVHYSKKDTENARLQEALEVAAEHLDCVLEVLHGERLEMPEAEAALKRAREALGSTPSPEEKA